MEIVGQIQADLLKQDTPISAILRKAKVLAAQLGSKELDTWVSQELDGYKVANELPDYRLIKTSTAGIWTNGYWVVKNRGVPLSQIKDKNLLKLLTICSVYQGIRTIEQFTKMKNDEHFILDVDTTLYVNSFVTEGGYSFSQLHYSLGPHNFEQLLDTVRNRLLEFVLKLSKKWNPKMDPPADDEISRLVSITIYNNPQGGSVTVFDQRGQNVSFQYNVAGNINIDAVNTHNELANELDKVINEVERARALNVLGREVAIEVEYHLQNATKEAKQERPKKQKLLEHIGKAKAILEDITAAIGLVTALGKAAEVVSKIF